MDLSSAASTAHDTVTSVAVLAGGIWVYFNYVRGRTFARRAQLDMTSSLYGSGPSYLHVTVTLKNTGQAKITLNEDMKVVRLYAAVDRPSNAVKAVDWERIATVPVLKDHAWLEAQEPVNDTILFQLPSTIGEGERYSAYRIEALIGTRRRIISRKGTLWQSSSFEFPVSASPAIDGSTS